MFDVLQRIDNTIAIGDGNGAAVTINQNANWAVGITVVRRVGAAAAIEGVGIVIAHECVVIVRPDDVIDIVEGIGAPLAIAGGARGQVYCDGAAGGAVADSIISRIGVIIIVSGAPVEGVVPSTTF